MWKGSACYKLQAAKDSVVVQENLLLSVTGMDWLIA